MTHIKSTRGKKSFVCKIVKRASPKKTNKIYRAVEKTIGYKPKRRSRRSYRKSYRKTSKRLFA